jgi:hypothetical protein
MSDQACSVTPCPRPHYAKGFCRPHYMRDRRYGTPGPAQVGIRYPAGAVCAFPECGRDISCGGLCASHYHQKGRQPELTPLLRRLNPLARDDQGRKQCTMCLGWFPISQYGRNIKTSDQLMPQHDRCLREKRVMKRYGITLDQYENLSSEQGDVCAICGGQNESGRALSVDHDHACCSGTTACGECVRDLLCSGCNTGIGQFRESASLLRAAALYLERHGVPDRKATQ